MMQITDLIEALTGERLGLDEQPIENAVIDSRLASKNSLFVALLGENTDGHDFVDQAFENGAVLALIEKDVESNFPIWDFTDNKDIGSQEESYPLSIRVENSLEALQQIARFWRKKLEIKVVGITGSVGKTTSKELIAEVLGQSYKTVKSEGNFNNEIGLPLTILSMSQEHEFAVLEMGFYLPGEISFLSEIAQPLIGVVTTVGLVHAERAGSQEAIFQGKSELVQALPKEGTAILNIDDPLVRKMAPLSNGKVFFYGLDPQADLWADEVEGLGLDGLRFQMHYKDELLHIHIPMIGRHSVHTALRATAVGLVAGMDWQSILEGLRIGQPQLRLVASRAKNGSILLDDTYNASPESTVAALSLLEELEGRKVAVLGDMLELGQYEEKGHQMVGNKAAAVADVIVTIGKRARIIAATAIKAGLEDNAVASFENSDQALKYLRENLKSSDVVLVKGSRAMNMDDIVPQLEMQT